jgi:threonine/homoserine/homoserine lactone efflux protein
MAGLPSPPDGANSYLYWLTVIEALVMPTASPGFQARLLVTFCLFLIFGIAALAALVVHCIAQRRLGRKLWLIKVVRRDTAR